MFHPAKKPLAMRIAGAVSRCDQAMTLRPSLQHRRASPLCLRVRFGTNSDHQRRSGDASENREQFDAAFGSKRSPPFR